MHARAQLAGSSNCWCIVPAAPSWQQAQGGPAAALCSPAQGEDVARRDAKDLGQVHAAGRLSRQQLPRLRLKGGQNSGEENSCGVNLVAPAATHLHDRARAVHMGRHRQQPAGLQQQLVWALRPPLETRGQLPWTCIALYQRPADRRSGLCTYSYFPSHPTMDSSFMNRLRAVAWRSMPDCEGSRGGTSASSDKPWHACGAEGGCWPMAAATRLTSTAPQGAPQRKPRTHSLLYSEAQPREPFRVHQHLASQPTTTCKRTTGQLLLDSHVHPPARSPPG